MNNSKTVFCYVALGSNLGDSREHIMKGLEALINHPDIHYLNISNFYLSKPHGPQDQLDYVNAAVNFETPLKAEALLDELQRIENNNGRIRENVERWGARTLDLDLLLYGDEVIDSKRLTVPHPRICERAFVLYPLRDLITSADIADLKITEKTTLNDCIANLSEHAKSEIKETILNG